MKRIIIVPFLIVILSVFVGTSCKIEESRPTYDPISNDLPSEGTLIKWDQKDGFTNMKEVENSLNSKHRVKFNNSMSWLATESDLNLSLLSGKTARETVDIANCLKTSNPNTANKCVHSN